MVDTNIITESISLLGRRSGVEPGPDIENPDGAQRMQVIRHQLQFQRREQVREEARQFSNAASLARVSSSLVLDAYRLFDIGLISFSLLNLMGTYVTNMFSRRSARLNMAVSDSTRSLQIGSLTASYYADVIAIVTPISLLMLVSRANSNSNFYVSLLTMMSRGATSQARFLSLLSGDLPFVQDIRDEVMPVSRQRSDENTRAQRYINAAELSSVTGSCIGVFNFLCSGFMGTAEFAPLSFISSSYNLLANAFSALRAVNRMRLDYRSEGGIMGAVRANPRRLLEYAPAVCSTVSCCVPAPASQLLSACGMFCNLVNSDLPVAPRRRR